MKTVGKISKPFGACVCLYKKQSSTASVLYARERFTNVQSFKQTLISVFGAVKQVTLCEELAVAKGYYSFNIYTMTLDFPDQARGSGITRFWEHLRTGARAYDEEQLALLKQQFAGEVIAKMYRIELIQKKVINNAAKPKKKNKYRCDCYLCEKSLPGKPIASRAQEKRQLFQYLLKKE